MAKFYVPMVATIYLDKEVEADSLEGAIDLAEQEGFPQVLTTEHDYPDMGDGWTVPQDVYNHVGTKYEKDYTD